MNEYPWRGRHAVIESGTERIPKHRQRCEVKLADGWHAAVYNRDGFQGGGDEHTFWDPDGWVMYPDEEVLAFRQLPPKPGPPGPSKELVGDPLHLDRLLAKYTGRGVVPSVASQRADSPAVDWSEPRSVTEGAVDGGGPLPPLETRVSEVWVPYAEERDERGERFCWKCGAFVGKWIGAKFSPNANCGVGRDTYRCKDHSDTTVEEQRERMRR